MQLERSLRVLGDRGGGDTPGAQQMPPAQNRRRAAEQRGVPEVQAALDCLVEHLALARHAVEGAEIALDRIRIDEEVRGLDQGQLGIAQEVADRVLEDVLGRHVIRVKHQNSDRPRSG